MSIVPQRQLTVIFRLGSQGGTAGSGTFTGTQSNTLTLTNVPASAKIVNAGGASMGKVDLDVYGLTLSQMLDLSTLGQVVSLVRRNEVTILAGNVGDAAPTQVFAGNIINAYADLNSQPSIPFRVSGFSLGSLAVVSTKPQSFTGSSDVATLLSGLASQMGLTFENNGVTAVVSKQYLYGSPREQALKVVELAGIEWNGGNDGALAIWPRTGSRKGPAAMPIISKASGMKDYPTFTQVGLQVETVYNPAIKFGILVQVQSSIKPASQVIKVMGLDHDLVANLPGKNAWFSTIRGYNPSNPLPMVNAT